MTNINIMKQWQRRVTKYYKKYNLSFGASHYTIAYLLTILWVLIAFLLVQLYKTLQDSLKLFIKWEKFGLEPDHFIFWIWNFPSKINNCMKYALSLSNPWSPKYIITSNLLSCKEISNIFLINNSTSIQNIFVCMEWKNKWNIVSFSISKHFLI